MSTTYATAKTKVLNDLDLQDEVFITAAEMLEYFNQAIRRAEQLVLGIYEDYLLDSANLSITNGTSKYSLPTGIYASKIRSILYNSGSVIYEIKRIRSHQKFLERALLRDANPTDYYKYIVVNSTANGIQIELSPAAKETSSTNVTVWFLRKVDAVTTTADYVDDDIPESLDFVYAYVKGKCKQKENAGTMPDDARQEIAEEEKMLVDTLTAMIPDDDNEVEADFSFYNETS